MVAQGGQVPCHGNALWGAMMSSADRLSGRAGRFEGCQIPQTLSCHLVTPHKFWGKRPQIRKEGKMAGGEIREVEGLGAAVGASAAWGLGSRKM